MSKIAEKVDEKKGVDISQAQPILIKDVSGIIAEYSTSYFEREFIELFLSLISVRYFRDHDRYIPEEGQDFHNVVDFAEMEEMDKYKIKDYIPDSASLDELSNPGLVPLLDNLYNNYPITSPDIRTIKFTINTTEGSMEYSMTSKTSLDDEQKYFTFRDVLPALIKLMEAYVKAMDIDPMLELFQNISVIDEPSLEGNILQVFIKPGEPSTPDPTD